MNPVSPQNAHIGLYITYIAAILSVFAMAVGLQLMVPVEVVDYVSNGIVLPVFRYGLLLSLIACGIALSGTRSAWALAGHLVILAFATWFGLQRAEAIVLSYKALADIVAGYPVLTATMSMLAGSVLLLPLSARKWLLPILSAVCGLGLGLSVVLESPYDGYAHWFSWAGGVGGLAIVLSSIILTNALRQFCAGTWLIIAERILGSWLIAASLMLAVLSFQQRPIEIPSLPPLSLDENDPS